MGRYCTRCGNQIKETAKFCSRCGARNVGTVNSTLQQQQIPDNQFAIKTNGVWNNMQNNNPINNFYRNDNVIYTPKTNNVAICGLLASIVGIFIASFMMGISSVICCIGAISRNKYTKEKGNGFAIAGIVIGIIEIVVMLYLMITNKAHYYSSILLYFMNAI